MLLSGCGNAPDEIPPIYDLTVAVKCDAAPKSVMLEPEHRPADYTYDGAYLHVKIEKLHIHTIIVVEPSYALRPAGSGRPQCYGSFCRERQ